MIGAGNFASLVLLPAMSKTPAVLKTIASSGGTSAALAARKFRFQEAASDYRTVLDDPAINTVFIATRHNTHAQLVIDALRAGKHVFVEKPLALNRDELSDIEQALAQAGDRQLLVGFNRRFSSLAVRLRTLLASRIEPCSLVYTVNAGAIPLDHWTQDLQVGGGRIVGEVCHFIDLLCYLAGHPIVGLEARMVGYTPSLPTRSDRMSILIEFADGSTGVVHYLANGSKSYPKERVEVFSQGRVLVLDNFKQLKGYGWPGFRTMRLSRQDKGHQAEVSAFVERIEHGGEWLIPWQTLREVTLATFVAMERAAETPRELK